MNFREWLNRFYHGSLKPLAIGTILQPQPHPGGEAVEVVISQNKPVGMLDRKDAVFLADDPHHIDDLGGYSNYVYVVEPVGKVERSDQAWYSEVEILLGEGRTAQDKEVIAAAKSYWKGTPYPDKQMSICEFRVPSAKVISSLQP